MGEWRCQEGRHARQRVEVVPGARGLPKLPVEGDEHDMVVFGTGFTKSYAYLEPALHEKLNRQSDGLYLYRNMFPTQVADLCFVGSEVSTFNNILSILSGYESAVLCEVLLR